MGTMVSVQDLPSQLEFVYWNLKQPKDLQSAGKESLLPWLPEICKYIKSDYTIYVQYINT